MVIALGKEIFNAIKNESRYVGLLFLIALIIFKIIYFNENLAVLIRFVFSLFWLFALPGYFITLYWKENLEFMERFVVGIALAAAIVGISSYYIGLIGIDIKYHTFLLPFLIIAIGLAAAMNKKNKNLSN